MWYEGIYGGSGECVFPTLEVYVLVAVKVGVVMVRVRVVIDGMGVVTIRVGVMVQKNRTMEEVREVEYLDWVSLA